MATKKPLYGVESLSIARTAGTHTWVTKWKVPSALTKGTKSSGKATKISTTWQLGIEGTDPRKYESIWNLSTTSSSVNVNNFKASTNRVYSRADFYPLTSRILSYVACTVTASNAGGASPQRPMVVFNFAKPLRPTVAPLEFDTATGVVSTTVTAAEDRTGYERYDTEYYFTVRRSDTGEELLAEHAAFTTATKALSYNVGSYQSIPQGLRRGRLQGAQPRLRWRRSVARGRDVVRRVPQRAEHHGRDRPVAHSERPSHRDHRHGRDAHAPRDAGAPAGARKRGLRHRRRG